MFLSTDLVLKAYEKGIFPMSDSNYDPYIYWVEPKERGVIDLKEFNKTRSSRLFKNNFQYLYLTLKTIFNSFLIYKEKSITRFLYFINIFIFNILY